MALINAWPELLRPTTCVGVRGRGIQEPQSSTGKRDLTPRPRYCLQLPSREHWPPAPHPRLPLAAQYSYRGLKLSPLVSPTTKVDQRI